MIYALLNINERNSKTKSIHVVMYSKSGEKITEETMECQLLEIRGTIRVSSICPNLVLIAEVTEGRIERRGNIVVIW